MQRHSAEVEVWRPCQSLRRTRPAHYVADTLRPILAHALSESSDFPMCAPCTSEGLGSLEIFWPSSCTSVSSSGSIDP
jgi:hypothetical protein